VGGTAPAILSLHQNILGCICPVSDTFAPIEQCHSSVLYFDTV